MRKLLALTFVLATAVLIGGIADATGGGGDGDPARTPTGVRYEWVGCDGDMAIVGSPGTPFHAFDSMGNPVADGVLLDSYASVPAGNSGIGADGVVLHVLIGEDIVAVTDPDWNWD